MVGDLITGLWIIQIKYLLFVLLTFLSHSSRVHPASTDLGGQRGGDCDPDLWILSTWGPVPLEERFWEYQAWRQVYHETEKDNQFPNNQSPEAWWLRRIYLSVQRSPHYSEPQSTWYVIHFFLYSSAFLMNLINTNTGQFSGFLILTNMGVKGFCIFAHTSVHSFTISSSLLTVIQMSPLVF